ncbi:MAG TPA: hypothetical protein VMV40_07215 [Acidiferrobacter sp.]|nr:hypothetical protein [Acidiferrobacter sp.]
MKETVGSDVRHLPWRERRVREWIAALPTTEPLRAISLLVQSVRALNSSVIDPATRIALLGHYDEPAMDLSTVVCKSETEGTDKTLAVSLHSEIAQGYQMALVPGLRPETRQKAVLGALRQLGEVVRAAYRNYIPVPPGLWRRIHGLFRGAGLASEAVELAYIRILLLGLADPYSLPAGGVDAVHRIILVTAQDAILNEAVGFAIATEADKPADPTGAEGMLFLDTEPLVAEITKLRAALRAHKVLPPSLASFLLPSLADRLFGSLIETWRPGPRRKSLRVRLGGERLLCQGLVALQKLIAEDFGHQGYVDLDELPSLGAMPARSLVGPSPVTTWVVRDAGRSGLWLSAKRLVGPPPAPGTWIGVKDPHREGQWRAAVVRWLKRSRPHEYAIGIEVLGEAQTKTVLSAIPAARSFVQAPRDRAPIRWDIPALAVPSATAQHHGPPTRASLASPVR